MPTALDQLDVADARAQSLEIARAAGLAVVDDLSGLAAAADFVDKVPIAFARGAWRPRRACRKRGSG